MSLSVGFSADWNGRPMAALDRALAAMQTHLNRTPKQAVSAMAINVLKGIRTRTRVAKKRGYYKLIGTPQYKPGFRTVGTKDGRAIVPTIRINGVRISGYRQTDGAREACKHRAWQSVQVFHVVYPERADMKSYYLVAMNESDAVYYIKLHHPIEQHRGAAQYALWHAMGKIAHTSGLPGVTASAAALASDLVTVTRQGDTGITIEDNLNYAKLAVKGGEAGMNAAVDAAVNKVMGQIKHKIHEQLRKEGFSV